MFRNRVRRGKRIRLTPALMLETVLIIAGVSKAISPSTTVRFVLELTNMRSDLAVACVGIVVTVLGVGELLLGVQIMSRRIWAIEGALVLLCLFTGILLIARLTGVSLECGCFPGLGLASSLPSEIIRNAVLIFLAIWCLRPALEHRGEFS